MQQASFSILLCLVGGGPGQDQQGLGHGRLSQGLASAHKPLWVLSPSGRAHCSRVGRP